MNRKTDASIHPRKLLFLLLLVNLFLFAFVLLMPSGELKITDQYSLHFVPLQEALHGKQRRQADITELVSSVIVDSITKEEQPPVPVIPNAPIHIGDTATDFKIAHASEGNSDLQHFFDGMRQCAEDGSPMAIGYYGDSQVEGDRFSDYLRNKLQKMLGGGGPGMVTPIDASNMRITIRQDESPEWIKLAAFGYPQSKPEGSRYGISGAIYRYRDGYLVSTRDSSGNDSLKKSRWVSSNNSPWLSFRRSSLSYATVKNYDRVSLWYSSVATVPIKINKGKSQLNDTLPASPLGTQTWLTDSGGYVQFTFPGAQSPDLIGIAFDREKGVRVDNYSMRGSSGTDFTKMNGGFLAEQHRLRGTKLLVLQYGVNVVPYVKDSAAVTYYAQSFLNQLRMLKRQMPDVSILVIGSTDISTKNGTAYETYPFLEMIRDAQKAAAFKAGCAFWDAYEAMGGRNSMQEWVFHDPPLAAKDFTHLAPRGANILAELLYKALMNDYQLYNKKQKLKNQNP